MSADARRPSRTDRGVALGLFLATFAVMLGTQADIGYNRDESLYFYAAQIHAAWFRLLLNAPSTALTDGSIVRFWEINHEHPVLMKSLFGLSYLVFHQGLGWASQATALRLPAFAASALIPAVLYLFGVALYGRKAGLFAALSVFAVPRQFFHAHLACFDMPIASAWLLVIYAYWRAQSERRWWLYTGVCFGLAIATKHNGLFLPFVVAPFALYRAWTATRENAPARAWALRFVNLYAAGALFYALLAVALGPEGFPQRFLLLSPHTALFLGLAAGGAYLLRQLGKESPEAFRPLAALHAMAVLGPVLFYALWPYLWHHPVDRTAWYLAFHAQHNNYTWYYLGRLLREPPFPLEYVVWVTALTVPLSLLLPMVLGLVSVGARAAARLLPRLSAGWPKVTSGEMLVLVNALASIAIISHPDVPHFGGVKHWFPSMPFLALLAGLSVSRAVEALSGLLRARRPSLPEAAVAAPVFALLLLPAVIATARVHPYGTAAYAELAGGVPGAASLGMQRQFWSSHVTGVLPWINANAPRGARLWLHEVTGYAFEQYQRNGWLRQDLVPAGGPGDADIAAYQYHQEFREQEFNIWQAFGTAHPVAGLYVDETPQIIVYRRP